MYNKPGFSLEIKITAAPSLVVRGNDGFLCLWSSYKAEFGKQFQFSTPGWFQARFQAAPAEPEASCSDFATFFPAAASSLSVPVRISVISVSEQQQPSISTFNLDINIKKKSWFPFFRSFWSSVFRLLWCVLGSWYLELYLLAFIHIKIWNAFWFSS